MMNFINMLVQLSYLRKDCEIVTTLGYVSCVENTVFPLTLCRCCSHRILGALRHLVVFHVSMFERKREGVIYISSLG